MLRKRISYSIVSIKGVIIAGFKLIGLVKIREKIRIICGIVN